MLISRSDRGLIADWWFSVDKVLLGCVLVLMASGVLFSMAASPPVAARLGLEHFHFFKRQLLLFPPPFQLRFARHRIRPRTSPLATSGAPCPTFFLHVVFRIPFKIIILLYLRDFI